MANYLYDEQLGSLEPVDLHAINTQDLVSFGEPTQSLSDFEGILDLDNEQQTPHVELPHWNIFPTLDPVRTDSEFEVHIDTGDKINWMYSVKLDKVYIKLNSPMNLTVAYRANSFEPMFVRAMIVFSRRDEIHLPVSRCPNHRMLSNEVPSFHILKCCNPGTEYHGIENESSFGRRSSLVVPLGRPQPQQLQQQYASNETLLRCEHSLGLEFLCQNSCSNGIQRKQTVLMLTLENERRQVFGKRIMNFKVCSCPKRDMSKEVNTAAPPQRKRPASGQPSTSSSSGKQPCKMICLQTASGDRVAGTDANTASIKQEMSPLSLTSTNGSKNEASPILADNGMMGVVVDGLNMFKFEATSSPDTLPMTSPQPMPMSMIPPQQHHQQQQQQQQQQQPLPQNVTSGGGHDAAGGYAFSVMLPSRESAQDALRYVYKDVFLKMARPPSGDPVDYASYVNQLEQYAIDHNMQL